MTPKVKARLKETQQPARARKVTVNNQPDPTTGKKSVAGIGGAPASVSNFCTILVMHFCKKLIIIDPYILAAVYAMLVTVVSVFTDITKIPASYFSNPKNGLNQYFVKLGWGWTCSLLGSFICLTSYTYCCANTVMVRKHLLRLVVATVWWWCCTSFFDYIQQLTGFCDIGKANEYKIKATCRDAGGNWLGFDISGHTFILIYALLIISEEVQCVIGWDKIADVIKTEEKGDSPKLTESELAKLKDTFEKFTPYVRLMVILLTMLVLLWNVMLLSTIIYFHNMPQKVLGMTFAISGWFVTYQIWFNHDIPYSPGPVGKGRVRYN